MQTVLLRRYHGGWVAPDREETSRKRERDQIARRLVDSDIAVMREQDWYALPDLGQIWLMVGCQGVGMVAPDMAGEPYLTIAEGIDVLRPGRYPVYSESGDVIESFEVPA